MCGDTQVVRLLCGDATRSTGDRSSQCRYDSIFECNIQSNIRNSNISNGTISRVIFIVTPTVEFTRLVGEPNTRKVRCRKQRNMKNFLSFYARFIALNCCRAYLSPSISGLFRDIIGIFQHSDIRTYSILRIFLSSREKNQSKCLSRVPRDIFSRCHPVSLSPLHYGLIVYRI